MIKFGKSLVEYEKKLIEFERKRTILYLSKLNNQKIWVEIWRNEKYEIISGVVKVIINGEINKNKHYLLGGEFRFNNDIPYSINDVVAISFRLFSRDDENYLNDYANMINSSIYGNESVLKSNILFSLTDFRPQDFNDRTQADTDFKFNGEFRSFNTRYYEIIAKSLEG